MLRRVETNHHLIEVRVVPCEFDVSSCHFTDCRCRFARIRCSSHCQFQLPRSFVCERDLKRRANEKVTVDRIGCEVEGTGDVPQR